LDAESLSSDPLKDFRKNHIDHDKSLFYLRNTENFEVKVYHPQMNEEFYNMMLYIKKKLKKYNF
jgi:hypothetical protein